MLFLKISVSLRVFVFKFIFALWVQRHQGLNVLISMWAEEKNAKIKCFLPREKATLMTSSRCVLVCCCHGRGKRNHSMDLWERRGQPGPCPCSSPGHAKCIWQFISYCNFFSQIFRLKCNKCKPCWTSSFRMMNQSLTGTSLLCLFCCLYFFLTFMRWFDQFY